MRGYLALSAVVAVVGLCTPSTAAGVFTKGPDFDPGTIACDEPYHSPGETCRRLAAAFAYSLNGVGWEASAGLITDGATIPEWARWLIGEPFAPEFAKAATLHDHYVRPEHQVRDYLTTHRMFYDALIDSGLDSLKAGVMYAAVLIGGPKWSVLVPGDKCTLLDGDGVTCIKAGEELYTAKGKVPSTDRIEAKYQALPMEQLLMQLEAEIKAGNLSPKQIEELALGRRVRLGYALPSLYVKQ